MKKIIASSILATIAVAGITGLSVSADEVTSTDSTKSSGFERMFDRNGGEKWDRSERGWKKGNKMGKMNLTETEKESIKDMSQEEKKAFMEAKKEAFKNMTDEEKTALKEKMQAEKEAKNVERQAKSQVIDDLLAGKTLTADQETLRNEIISERAEKKANKLERDEKREVIKAIIEKKKAGTELTDEEENTLSELKSNKGGKKWGKMWGKRGERR